MEPSPLTQQARPATFQPKIVQLYMDLFRQDEQQFVDLDGFWEEMFLLKPDKPRLQQLLDGLSTDDLLHSQHETQQLFVRAIRQVKAGKTPSMEHALDVSGLEASLRSKLTLTSSDLDSLLRCHIS